MKAIQPNIIKIVLISSLLILSCDRETSTYRSEIIRFMDIAEKELDSAPDSALCILENIDYAKVHDQKLRARLSLLKTMATDKNFIDTTDLDILQPALDYFLAKGTPEERKLTLYYEGRIFQNQKDEAKAMTSFIKALETKSGDGDLLLTAKILSAQNAIFYSQYKIDQYILNSLKIAQIYSSLNNRALQMKWISNSLDAEIMRGNRKVADSLANICTNLLKDNKEGIEFFYPTYLSYIVEYGTPEKVSNFLEDMPEMNISKDLLFNLTRAYSKIGDNAKALKTIEKIKLGEGTFDSLRYYSIKSDIMEQSGEYKSALAEYKKYISTLEKHHDQLIHDGQLFAEERHEYEIKELKQNRNKKLVIIYCSGGAIILCLILLFLLTRYRMTKYKKKLVESENEALRTEIEKLENEENNLRTLLKKSRSMDSEISDLIKQRLKILDGLITKELTNNNNLNKSFNKWIQSALTNKEEFLNSTRKIFKSTHPKFYCHLTESGLTIEEINYACLYIMGFRGNEIGQYMQSKSHYNVSSGIRKKLGLNEHNTNLGNHLKTLSETLDRSDSPETL